MRILAIDTSLTSISTCVYDDEIEQVRASESVLMQRGHAEILMPMVERVVGRLQHGFSSLDKVAVTVGPGSFTGIRVGVAAAKAIGIAMDIPVVGVSTLAAFAAPLVLEGGDTSIVAAIDARHGNVYFQVFDPYGRTIIKPHLATSREAVKIIGEGPFRTTGNAGPIMAIEAWALLHAADAAGELYNPLIEHVARLGVSADPEFAPPDPLYLKAADVTLPLWTPSSSTADHPRR